MRIPILQKTWDKKIKHYLHVCVFFVTEIPRREEIMTKVRTCPVCAPWIMHSLFRNTFCSDGDAEADWPYMAALQDLPQHNATMDDGVSEHRLLM